MTHVILVVFSVIIGLFAPTEVLAQTHDSRIASLLANRIQYLSAQNAREFVPHYRFVFDECLQGLEEKSWENRLSCLELAVNSVRDLTTPSYSQRIVRDRIRSLRLKGHLSNYGIVPDISRPSFGIVGDSLAVGAMAAEHINPHAGGLIVKGLFNFLLLGENVARDSYVDVLNGLNVPPSRVLRIFDSPERHKTGFARYFENKGSRYVDCEECAFPYSVARTLGYTGSNIFVAGQSGKRVSTISEQFKRLTLPLEHLPDNVIVSYTANDICHPDNEGVLAEEKYAEYYGKLVEQFRSSIVNSPPSPDGTKIFVVAAADVGNLLENRKVLSREVGHWFPGGPNKSKVTCEDIRYQKVGGAKNLAGMCPYILNTTPDDKQRILHIKSLHQAIVRAQKDAVDALNREGNQGFQFHFLDSILGVSFDPEDISSDCFHPSTSGQDKIAEKIFEEIRGL